MVARLGLSLTVLYTTFGRSFAYIGSGPIYPGEIFLVVGLLAKAGDVLRGWAAACLKKNTLACACLMFLGWGAFAAARGISQGELWNSLKGFATNYYLAFLYVGLSASRDISLEGFLAFMRAMAWFNGVYGIAFGLVLSRSTAMLPWAQDIPLFSPPAMPSFAFVSVLACSPLVGTRSRWLLTITAFAMLLNPGRGLWLSALLGTAVIVALSKNRLKRTGLIAMVAIAVVVVVWLAGSALPVAAGRGGSLSPHWLVARVVATFDADAAYSFLGPRAPDAAMVYGIAGSAHWRITLWKSVIESLQTPSEWIVGHGYGVSLGEFSGYGKRLRTPHNFLIYLLGYTGLIGVFLYSAIIKTVVSAVVSLPKSCLKTLLAAQLTTVLTLASVGNAIESPIVAMPFYFTIGVAYNLARRLELQEAHASHIASHPSSLRIN